MGCHVEKSLEASEKQAWDAMWKKSLEASEKQAWNAMWKKSLEAWTCGKQAKLDWKQLFYYNLEDYVGICSWNDR